MKVGVRLPADFADVAEFLADAAAFDAAGADWLWVDGTPVEAPVLLAAVAAVAPRAHLVANLGQDSDCSEGCLTGMLRALERVARGRRVVVLRGELPPAVELPGSQVGEVDRRLLVPAPESRAAWAASLARAEAAGAQGVLVDAGPRLLDLMRNQEPGDGRPDLQLAQG